MEADLTAEKMQVDAANAADDDQARIRKSNQLALDHDFLLCTFFFPT